MGQVMSSSPQVPVHSNLWKEPSFDPQYGFRTGRKERVMIATQEEMEAAMMPLKNRDYCAHHMLDLYRCRKDVWPLVYKCHNEKHTVQHCQHEDYILRKMEFEREKRLRQRQERKERLNLQ